MTCTDATTGVEFPDAAELAMRALGPTSRWLRVSTDRAPADAVTVADLVADDGRRIDEILAAWHALDPSAPSEYRAGVVGTVAWMLLAPAMSMIARARCAPVLDLGEVRLQVTVADDDVAHVWWPAGTAVVPAADVEAILATLVEAAIGALAPLVGAVRLRAPVGRRGLWGRVVDAMTAIGSDDDDADIDQAKRDLDALRRAVRGTVLDQPIVVVEYDVPQGRRCVVRTVACCFAYKASHEESDGWDRYCVSCPLIPVEETIARLTDHARGQTPGVIGP
jgi:hypothetical protein